MNNVKQLVKGHLNEKFILIAGPCVAENKELLFKIAPPLIDLCGDLKIDFFFKASFDKANRTSFKSYRGPGWETAKSWFLDLKERFGCKILTDIHETAQVKSVAEVCEGLQIPAFLCRQTDLLVEAMLHGQFVNIKKGQFLAPSAMPHLLHKAIEVKESGQCRHKNVQVALTERGASFGYGDLVVDMRSLPIMAATGAPVIYDATHSVQQPSTGQAISGGSRAMVPYLARSAAATGQLGGLFLEVHENPPLAKSDAASQLSIDQALELIKQTHELWKKAKEWVKMDHIFAT